MAEAVGVPQDQRGSTNFNALNGVLSNEQDSFGDIVALAPKTRKAYTITKQRERWTEEEHKKFLEALQLHGRAWRRIEEHIGTKTAVQIRSHAQKFFSKVTRDATGNGTGDMKPIEIPPPRPKKKPTHPYPRKQVLSCTKGIPFLGRLKRSSSPVLSVSESENRSPTSVLSAVRSESIDPFFSNNPNGCASPAGFAPGSNDYENGISSPTNSVEGDDRHLSLGLTSTGLTTEDQSSMELDMNSSVEHIHSKEAPSREAIVPTLKLFGKTMVVTDSYKPFSESNCNGSEFDPEKPTEEMMNKNFLMNNTWPGGLLPTLYCWPPSFGDATNLAAEARVVPLPWWPFPYAYYTQQNLSSREDLLQFNLQNECSGTGSNSAYEGANAVESEQSDLGSDYKEAAFYMLPKPSKVEIGAAVTDRKCSRGFVPYRRGALEEKVKSPDISGEAVKLCL